jgi:uncharacterized protein (TIGR00297 family)
VVSQLPRWALGFLLASVIALIAWRARSLTWCGAIAAVAMGTVAVAAGWDWGILLVLYFVSSSALSHFRRREKEAASEGRVEKSGERDSIQVFANGGVFMLSALAYGGEPRLLWQLAGAGALAASAADTWATEIGVLSRTRPRSILGLQPVEPGVSGGVTVTGTLAAFGAAALIALAMRLLGWPMAAAVAAFAGGVAGCFLDSVLGASLQSRRYCDACGQATEARMHRCGNATRHVGGLGALNNDGVNFLATAGGAAAGVAIGLALA